MTVETREEPLTAIAEHTAIPIAFEVTRRLEPVPAEDGLGGVRLAEMAQDPAYVKDYDAIAGNRPTDWAGRVDSRKWALLSAWRGRARVGGALLVHDSPSLHMLEGRSDLAVLWDLRVLPEERRTGVGSALIYAAERWSRTRGCNELKVETQNINVPACRFYARHGFELRTIHRFAYPSLPDEIQLLWHKKLAG